MITEMISKRVRAELSKLKFSMGFTPSIYRNGDIGYRFIPKPFKAVCLISADFEMAWASRYSKNSKDPLKKAVEDGLRTRKNVPIILDLCDKYGIPITWATVGHLFLESCSKVNGVKHPELPRLPYFENKFWKFDKGDWFDYAPCSDYKTDPAWYAPDLIRDILSRKIEHEIGCHTFSHVDCRDSIDDGTVFKAELKECIRTANKWGLELKSFVHPGHTIGNLDTLADLGFSSIRTDFGDRLALPSKLPNGLWEFKNTAELTLRKEWSPKYHVFRYKKIIDRAIKFNRLCVLWFHPSFDEVFVDKVLPSVLFHLQKRSREITILTHGSYTEVLNNNASDKCDSIC